MYFFKFHYFLLIEISSTVTSISSTCSLFIFINCDIVFIEGFKFAEFDKIVVVYNSFVNAGVQLVKTEQFLPIVPTVQEGEATGAGDYFFEPSKAEIVEELIPKSLKIQLFKSLLDSSASEHGARMTAIHKATDNSSDLKRDLTLQYNKARQAAITNEILEIVGGAEALNG